jgi:cell division protein FtsB
MRPNLTNANVLKQLETVSAQLAAGKVTGEKRMDLLRRQAQLGDLRDAIAERARRNAASM